MNEADKRRFGLSTEGLGGTFSYNGKPEQARQAGSLRPMQREAVSLASSNLEYWADYWDFEAMALHYFREMAFCTPDGTADHQYESIGGGPDFEGYAWDAYIRARCRAEWRATFDTEPWSE